MLAPLGTGIAAAGFAASLTGIYIGMRDTMASGSGFCARGGPYVIGSQCSQGQLSVLLIGFVGLVVFWGVHAGLTGWSGGPVFGSALLGWAALFGVLGWNFMDFGVFDPPQGKAVVGGWLISGIVFWAMAACGLVSAIALAFGWARRRGEPEPSLFREPLVRANVPVPPPPLLRDTEPPEDAATSRRKRSAWFAATAIGAAAGIPLGKLVADALL